MKGNARKRIAAFAAIAIVVNIVAVFAIGAFEAEAVRDQLAAEVADVEQQFDEVMDGYEHSFNLFTLMVENEIGNDPDPDSVEAFLKDADKALLEAEGESYDGLYLYYKDRYLYSWDTPFSVYEESGYVATERPWYQAAVAAQGGIAFTPPYMSYANNYILSTIARLQPDGETVVAYDVKMGDIQNIAAAPSRFADGSIMIFDANGTVIGSTDERFLGSDLHSSAEDAQRAAAEARADAEGSFESEDERAKTVGKAESSAAFASFWTEFSPGFEALEAESGSVRTVVADGTSCYAYLRSSGDYGALVFVPATTIWASTVGTWLVPLLVVELLLVYALMSASRAFKNRELKAAYVELGQMQSRLEIALTAAQKDAAIDDLTGMMNMRSFRRAVGQELEGMQEGDRGIFIMLDGDRFKQVNDTFGHDAGDEAIKLSAQMIVGRIRTVDLASRLHGDEFAIFLAGTDDYEVARRLVRDVNDTIKREASKRGVPTISLSAGAVAVRPDDSFVELSKKADEALYRAKESHDGGFAHGERLDR